MTTLVVGASGATGRLLVEQLLNRGQHVHVIVRSPAKLPAVLTNHNNLSVIRASVLELSDAELSQHVSGCCAVALCLGHTMSLQGIFGHPRKLVTDATVALQVGRNPVFCDRYPTKACVTGNGEVRSPWDNVASSERWQPNRENRL
jgi:NAD(P)-dependent dehydrogenase (short-subunit alcohol dehydrogenase family)